MNFPRAPAILSVLLVVTVVVLFVRTMFDFHYQRAIDNHPLTAPHNVLLVQGRSIHLEDGRTIVLDKFSSQLGELITSSGNRIDLEVDEDGQAVDVFVKSQFAACGDPFVAVRRLFPPYCIPLFPDDYPVNYRDRIGHGTFVADSDLLSKER